VTRIVRIFPGVPGLHLDIIVEEQAAYYGQHNEHVLAWLNFKLLREM
jgi:hypothetical protein